MAKKEVFKKRPYCSPKVTRVDLKSEDAVLTACKVYGNATPYGAGNSSCKYHNFTCSAEGS